MISYSGPKSGSPLTEEIKQEVDRLFELAKQYIRSHEQGGKSPEVPVGDYDPAVLNALVERFEKDEKLTAKLRWGWLVFSPVNSSRKN